MSVQPTTGQYEVGTEVTTPRQMFGAPVGTRFTSPQGNSVVLHDDKGLYLQHEEGLEMEIHLADIHDLDRPFPSGAVWTVTELPEEEPTFWGRTASQWREMAADCYRRRAESIETSDTDGFLSQWAAQEMAVRYEHCAEIAEAGGTMVVRALFDLDGNLVPARRVETRYGMSWGVYGPDYPEDTQFDHWFNESKAQDEARARATNAKKGIYIGQVRVRAALNRSSGEPFATEDLIEVVDNGQGVAS